MSHPFACTRRRLAAFGLLLLAVVAASGSVLPDSVLSEVQTVALRRSSSWQSAAPCLRLDSAALARSGTTSLSQVLRRLPGVILRDYGGAGGLKTVSVRGLGAAHTVVTYDGMPVGEAQSGMVDFRRFSLHRLHEVQLSVADADALLVPVRTLGAAHIALNPGEGKREAGIRAGSFGAVAPSVGWQQQFGQTAITLDADYQRSDNRYPFQLNNGKLRTNERREHNAVSEGQAALRLRHTTPGGTTLAAGIDYDDTHRQLPGPVMLYTKSGTEKATERNASLHGRVRKNGSRWQWQAGGKATMRESRYLNLDAQFPGGRLDQRYRQREAYLTAGIAHTANGGWQWAYAADYTLASLHSNLNADNRVARHSLQQALSLRLRRGRWTATVRGLLHLHHNQASTAEGTTQGLPWQQGETARDAARFTHALSVAYRLWHRQGAEWLLRAHHQHIFRMPSFTESYYFHYGSTRLRPELTRQFGVGSTLQWLLPNGKGQGAASLDAYRNHIDDRIVALPFNMYVWRTTNVGAVRAQGFDAALVLEICLHPQHRLHLSGNYSLQSVTDRTDPDAPAYGKQMAYTPLHSGTASARWENPWCALNLTLDAAASRWSTHEHLPTTRLPAYAEIGAGISRTFRLSRRQQLLVRLDGINLTDRQYEIVRRYPMPRRHWRAALLYRF